MTYQQITHHGINEVDEKKVTKIVESMLSNGWVGMPILVVSEGTVLITGSHRIDALNRIAKMVDESEGNEDWYETAYNLIYKADIAEEVDDLINAWLDAGNEWEDFQYDKLSDVFAGTWVEKYKDELPEW